VGVNTSVGTGVNTGMNFGTGGATHSIITTGGATHTIMATGGAASVNTGVITATYTSTSLTTGTGIAVGCHSSLPVVSGTLSVTGGYVTTGSLKGYGFTWVGRSSNASTCITPSCDTTGCTPAFGSTSLCGAGVVFADATYNSAAGVGFNLNQDAVSGAVQSVAAPASITVSTIVTGSLAGNWAMRVQISDTLTGINWCVEAGKWASGTPIPITAFNTACWDNSGSSLSPGAPISSINIVVPSEATTDRPFSFCLAGVTVD